MAINCGGSTNATAIIIACGDVTGATAVGIHCGRALADATLAENTLWTGALVDVDCDIGRGPWVL